MVAGDEADVVTSDDDDTVDGDALLNDTNTVGHASLKAHTIWRFATRCRIGDNNSSAWLRDEDGG